MRIVLLVAFVAVANAMVCLPNACDGVARVEMNCRGSVIKNGGFCGCTDLCAKIEGEQCTPPVFLGLSLSRASCDTGLECRRATTSTTGADQFSFTCAPVINTSERAVLTPCQQKRRMMQIILVIYKGMWTPRCDPEGAFLPEQCDNEGQCFCVDQNGKTMDGTKVKGNAQC
ncbi:hypothetical protein ScPMuIL_008392 [Solemya velum]